MQKTLLIMKNEFITTVMRPSFLFSLFGLPLIAAVIFAVVGLLNRNQPGQVEQLFSPAADTQPFGYVDMGGLIKSGSQSPNLIAYPNEASAKKALDEGSIAGFYILPADYLKTGQLTYIRTDFNPLTAFDRTDGFQELIDASLLGNDAALVQRYNTPLVVKTVNQNPKPAQAQESALSMLLPTGITVLFYIILVTSSSLLLNNITKEKENRVLEILMSSVDSYQILTGKIVALGLVGLLQTGVWMGMSLLLLGAGQQSQMIPAGLVPPVSFLVWALVYFLGGYVLYASLMAGIGALVPNLREASQATTLVIMPMVIPLVLMSNLIQDPNGPLAVALSMIPLTSPVAMLTRMSAGDVPLWQTGLGAVLLILGAVWVIRAVSGFFRGQVMLSGQSFSSRRFLRALMGRLD